MTLLVGFTGDTNDKAKFSSNDKIMLSLVQQSKNFIFVSSYSHTLMYKW